MQAKRLVLTAAQAKLLADTVETPKVTEGQPEPLNTDLLRRMQQARRILIASIHLYLDAFDAIIDEHDGLMRGAAEAEKGFLVTAANQKLADLDECGLGGERHDYLVSNTEMHFLIDRFDNRNDLTPNNRLIRDRLVAISDALAAARASEDVPVEPVTVQGGEENGLPTDRAASLLSVK